MLAKNAYAKDIPTRESKKSQSYPEVFDDETPVENDSECPFKELTIKVIIVGDAAVGKTSFIQRYVTNAFQSNYKWTVGVDFALKRVEWSEKTAVKLQLWDVAGQERFSNLTRVYYRDAQACIVMFDLSRRDTFLGARRWVYDLENKCANLKDGSSIPCLLLANKCDLSERQVYQEEIEEFCKEHDFIGWTETSVKEGQMVKESMKFLLEAVMVRCGESDITKSARSHSRIQLNNVTGKPKRSCHC